MPIQATLQIAFRLDTDEMGTPTQAEWEDFNASATKNVYDRISAEIRNAWHSKPLEVGPSGKVEDKNLFKLIEAELKLWNQDDAANDHIGLMPQEQSIACEYYLKNNIQVCNYTFGLSRASLLWEVEAPPSISPTGGVPLTLVVSWPMMPPVEGSNAEAESEVVLNPQRPGGEMAASSSQPGPRLRRP